MTRRKLPDQFHTCVGLTKAGYPCQRQVPIEIDLCAVHRVSPQAPIPVQPPPEQKLSPSRISHRRAKGNFSMERTNKKWTEEDKRVFIHALEQGMGIAGAARLVGFSRRTVSRLMSEVPDFAAAVQAAQAVATDNVEETLYTLAMNGLMPAVKMYLEANRPEVYRQDKAPQVQIGVSGGNVVAISGGDQAAQRDRIGALLSKLEKRRELEQVAGEWIYDAEEVVDVSVVTSVDGNDAASGA